MGSAVVIGEISAGLGIGQRDISLGAITATICRHTKYVCRQEENLTGGVPQFHFGTFGRKERNFSELSDEDDDQLQFAIAKLREQIG